MRFYGLGRIVPAQQQLSALSSHDNAIVEHITLYNTLTQVYKPHHIQHTILYTCLPYPHPHMRY